jgi:hypothetical protein
MDAAAATGSLHSTRVRRCAAPDRSHALADVDDRRGIGEMPTIARVPASTMLYSIVLDAPAMQVDTISGPCTETTFDLSPHTSHARVFRHRNTESDPCRSAG